MVAPASAFFLICSMTTFGALPGPSDPITVSGIIVDRDDQPAPGTELFAAGSEAVGEAIPGLIGQATTGPDGRFTLNLGADPGLRDRSTLWIYRPGSVVATVRLDRSALSGGPIHVKLGSPGRSDFVVAGPDGRPILGARVAPRRIFRDDLVVPGELADRLSSTTDDQGRASLSSFRPEELVGVRIEAPGYGWQSRDFRERDGHADVKTKGITLIAPGRVSGRVVADDPAAVSGLVVRATTSIGGRDLLEAGFADAVTDASGRFEIPFLASGPVSVRVRPRAGSPEIPRRVVRRILEPGKGLNVEIPLIRGVKATGIARDLRDGKPVAGALIAVVPSGSMGPSRVWTDADGRYSTFIPAGLATHRVLLVPEPYLCPPDFLGPRPVEVPPAIASFELPPIDLTQGTDLNGSVVDEDGRGVSGAHVEATWTMFDGRIRAPRSASARSRPDGSFLLGPVDPQAELALTASSGLSSTAETLTVKASSHQPILVRVVEPAASSPAGRVVDREGKPVAGALVRIWSMNGASGGSILWFDGSDHLVAGPSGRFQGPRRLRPDREYRAMAVADGHLAGRTRALRPGPSGVLTFPEIVLTPEPDRVALQGRVIDRQGQPVAGAEVRVSPEGPCRRQTVTDLAGNFRLDDLPEGAGFLFVEAPAYRFLGRAIGPEPGRIDLTLTRLDEAPTAEWKTRAVEPVPITIPRGLLAGYVERVLSQGDHATKVRTLELLARIDPRRVLALVDARGVEDAWFADHLRQSAALALIGSNAEEAVEAIQAIHETEWRAMASMQAAGQLPASSRALKRQWIDRAWADARMIRDPASRVIVLAGVADRLIGLGEDDAAHRLMTETRPIAESLSMATSGGRARADFAGTLARIAPDEALAMTEGLVDPGVHDRAHLKIAQALAATDPARASKVLASLRDPRSIAGALPGLCRAMAPTSPDLARRLLTQTRSDDPTLPAYALGMMADAVSTTHKLEATAWLLQAFDRLDELARSHPTHPGTIRDPASVAAALLPVAERIDPRLVPEFFWRALSFQAERPVADVRSEAIFVFLIARYDRAIALSLFEPLAARADHATDTDLEPLVAAAAVLGPDLGIHLVEKLAEAPDLGFHQPKNGARLALAAALARPALASWDEGIPRFLHLGTADARSEE